MVDSSLIDYCALGLGPCWTRGEWIALWSSFGGVLVAFLLGYYSRKAIDARKNKAASEFLRTALLKGMDALIPFEAECRQIITDEHEIARGFGALSHIAAATKWALAHPEQFPPKFFLDLIMVSDRMIEGSKLGPSSFAGERFYVAASTHLWKTGSPILADIRFLFRLPKPSSSDSD